MPPTSPSVLTSTSRWSRPAGYRDVLRIAVPLVLSTGSWSVQNFVDRMFLAWFSSDAMAATLPAGMLAFTSICFCMGTASYANVFVAQYHGAGQNERVGPAVWQAVRFAIVAGLLLPLLGFLGAPIFRLAGHAPAVRALETTYYEIVMYGGLFTLLSAAISCFYSGLGRTWPMVWVNLLTTVVNIALDYGMIFGHWGFPRLGMAGAAWATVLAQVVGCGVYLLMLLQPANDRVYHTRRGHRFDLDLMKRLLRFGTPSGLQFMTDIMAFTAFTLIVGRIGARELAATNVAFQVNMLAFMPMIGFGIATQTLVGQWLGRGDPEMSARATWSSFHITFGYMAFFALAYLLVPRLFIMPFISAGDAAEFAPVAALARTILHFVAFYCLFDTMNIIFSSALKGAGDTRFVMWFSVAAGWMLMVVPTAVAVLWLGGGIFSAWTFLTLYVSLVGFGFLWRFLKGGWKTMQVIEATPTPLPVELPAIPTAEIDA